MKFFIKKSTTLIITLFVVSLLAFLAFHSMPSDVVTNMLGTSATEETVEALREELGLNRPVMVQYADWLGSLLQGDFGTSYSYNMAVGDMIAEKLPITAALVGLSCLMVIFVSIPCGIIVARNTGGILDRVFTVLNQIFMSIPPVFVGIILTYIFGTVLKVFSVGQYVSYKESPLEFWIFMLFPALSIALSRIAMTVKMLKSSLLEEMERPYIRTAYSRGHSRSSALMSHALRNALVPTITFIAISAAEMVAASIIIEQVFALPGIGRLLLTSIFSRDYPVVLAIVVILAAWVVIVNFIAELIAQRIDPRIRLG